MEHELLGLAAALGAADVPSISSAEQELLSAAPPVSRAKVERARNEIADGADPLGDFFARARSARLRRHLGATYTPLPIAREMARWACEYAIADRVVDPGVGSGRFLRAVAPAYPHAQLIGTDVDPLAALIARASLATAGLAERSTILMTDYRAFALERIEGRTLFIGNPPYVRHHQIHSDWKEWFTETAASRGFSASQLAGLHVHFYLATVTLAKAGDFGAFITSSEWLDVNYGKLVRELFLGPLGGSSLVIIDPAAKPFPDAATTAVISTFEAGSAPACIHIRRAETAGDVAPVGEGASIGRERLVAEQRWSYLLRAPRSLPDGYVELGEICRVHRGAVTGRNEVWIAESHDRELPQAVLYRSVTKARELIHADPDLHDARALRHVIDIPEDLGTLAPADRKLVERFLRWARRRGAHESYVARHRPAWWSVGLRQPPPILATYMARRPPTFVRNSVGARYINIAHGLYPRDLLSRRALDRLRMHLSEAASEATGRVYAGGLRKFEPRELERIGVPAPEALEAPS